MSNIADSLVSVDITVAGFDNKVKDSQRLIVLCVQSITGDMFDLNRSDERETTVTLQSNAKHRSDQVKLL